MKTVVFDFAFMQTPAHFYRLWANLLPMPAYFGRNLDALWDVLSSGDIPLPLTIEFRHVPQQEQWCQKLITLFEEAKTMLGNEFQFRHSAL